MQVITLTENMQEVKQKMLLVEEQRVEALKKDKSTQLANQFVYSIRVEDTPIKAIMDISDKRDSLSCEQIDDGNDKDSIDLDNIGDNSRILDLEKEADDVLQNVTTSNVSQS